MRFRKKNYKEEDKNIFSQLTKNNPYIAHVYNFPNILLPHPSIQNFQELLEIKKRKKTKLDSKKIHLEIGCGSGRYLIEWANKNTQDTFIGIELRYKRLVLAAKKIDQQHIKNILLMRDHGEFFDEYFQKYGLDYLHINFPDPWTKKKQRKNRLLNKDFIYKLYSIMSFNGEFRFKTDHLEYFETVTKILAGIKGFTITEYSKNLHSSIYNEKNILTEFEMLFKSKRNPPIGYLLAKKIN
mgnify:CR=1 FL=1